MGFCLVSFFLIMATTTTECIAEYVDKRKAPKCKRVSETLIFIPIAFETILVKIKVVKR